MSITFSLAESADDLRGILSLQKANLARNLDAAGIESQGFVTVDHRYEELKMLNDIEPHVLAKDGDQVIAYILAMTSRSGQAIGVLVPMFQLFNEIAWKGKKIADYRYLVVGQVCVEKDYRGRGVFDNCYSKYREQFSPNYDFAITEIALSNQRSLRAHIRVGYNEIHRYTAPGQTDWYMVLWDWRK